MLCFQVSNVAIGIAVFAFYILDFALNALQASLRNLLLDITPPEQLNAGNAWHSRMSQAGNIVGYGFGPCNFRHVYDVLRSADGLVGFLPLAKLPFLSFLGGDQFRKFCILSMTILVITVWITCFCHEEKETVDRRKDKYVNQRLPL
jgi:solute carrier family 45 protein 1/2/4